MYVKNWSHFFEGSAELLLLCENIPGVAMSGFIGIHMVTLGVSGGKE